MDELSDEILFEAVNNPDFNEIGEHFIAFCEVIDKHTNLNGEIIYG